MCFSVYRIYNEWSIIDTRRYWQFKWGTERVVDFNFTGYPCAHSEKISSTSNSTLQNVKQVLIINLPFFQNLNFKHSEVGTWKNVLLK